MKTAEKKKSSNVEEKEQKSPLYAFYGSLRKGMGNNPMLQGCEWVKDGVIKGFKLYSLGAYPFIVKTDNNSDTVIVELYDMKDKSTEKSVHWMEIGAGYERELVDVDGTEAYVYTQTEARNYPLVEDGDWVKFKQSQQSNRSSW